jgi:hypothetical protein
MITPEPTRQCSRYVFNEKKRNTKAEQMLTEFEIAVSAGSPVPKKSR